MAPSRAPKYADIRRETTSEDRLLSLPETAEKLTYSPHTISRKMKEPDFPKPVYLSERRLAFYESEVDAYIRSRPREYQPSAKAKARKRRAA